MKPSAVAVVVPNVGVNAVSSDVSGTVVVVTDGTVVVVTDGTVVVAEGAVVVVTDGTVVVTDGTVVVTDGTVVVAEGAVVVVTDGRVGVVVCVDTHGSMTDGENAKPPSSTNGATKADIRAVEARTQRVTITPAINKNKPATTTNDERPVAGSKHTSTANTKTPAQ